MDYRQEGYNLKAIIENGICSEIFQLANDNLNTGIVTSEILVLPNGEACVLITDGKFAVKVYSGGDLYRCLLNQGGAYRCYRQLDIHALIKTKGRYNVRD